MLGSACEKHVHRPWNGMPNCCDASRWIEDFCNKYYRQELGFKLKHVTRHAHYAVQSQTTVRANTSEYQLLTLAVQMLNCINDMVFLLRGGIT